MKDAVKSKRNQNWNIRNSVVAAGLARLLHESAEKWESARMELPRCFWKPLMRDIYIPGEIGERNVLVNSHWKLPLVDSFRAKRLNKCWRCGHCVAMFWWGGQCCVVHQCLRFSLGFAQANTTPFSKIRREVIQVRLLHVSVEHDPVYDPTGFCNSERNQDRTGFQKELNRIRYGYPNCVDHCSEMLDQRVFRIQTGLDQIFGQVYRIRIGPEYSMKILDWIRIAKISNLFNTTTYKRGKVRACQDGAARLLLDGLDERCKYPRWWKAIGSFLWPISFAWSEVPQHCQCNYTHRESKWI